MKPSEFGEYLKKLRKDRGLTLTELAHQSGVSQPYLSQIEIGNRGIPSPDKLRSLAEPLGVDYFYLMAKAGYYSDKEALNHKIIYDRAVNDFKETELKDLFEDPRWIRYNGHLLDNEDRKRILAMLDILFPEYTKRGPQ